MQKFLIIFKSFLIIILLLNLISCSSSTYLEDGKYKVKKINTPSNIPNPNYDKAEDDIPQIPYDNLELEQKSILNRIYEGIKPSRKKELFLNQITNYLNTPYQYGGTNANGIDCSAFTQQVYQNSLSVGIPRTAREQYKINEIFREKELLKFGDLVYFDTSDEHFPGHVGIYLQDDLFAHASSSNGVIISSLNNYYYLSRFVGANRVTVKKWKLG